MNPFFLDRLLEQDEPVRARHLVDEAIDIAIVAQAKHAPARILQSRLPLVGEIKVAVAGESQVVCSLEPFAVPVMFDDEATYQRVLKVLTKERFSRMYKVPQEDVLFFEHDAAKAIKISIPRPYVQGSRNDGDAYGGTARAAGRA